MICKWCKEETPDGSLFCERCGKLLGHNGDVSSDSPDASMAGAADASMPEAVDALVAGLEDVSAPDSAAAATSDFAFDPEAPAHAVTDVALEDAQPSGERPSALAAWVKMAEEEYEAEHADEIPMDPVGAVRAADAVDAADASNAPLHEGRHVAIGLHDSETGGSVQSDVMSGANDSQSDEDYSSEFVDIDDAVHTEDGWASVAFGDVDAMPMPDDDEFFVDDPAWPEQPRLGKARVAVIAVISTLFAAAMILLFCAVMMRVLGL